MRRVLVLAFLVLSIGCSGGDDEEVDAAAAKGTTSTTARVGTTIVDRSTTTAPAAPAPTSPAPAPPSTDPTATANPTAPPSTTASTTATPTTTTAAPAPPATTELTVTVADFAFSPSSLTAPAGEIRFIATNEDAAAHTFTVAGTAVDIPLPPNGSGRATATLAAGDYDFSCRIHPSMTGSLTVS